MFLFAELPLAVQAAYQEGDRARGVLGARRIPIAAYRHAWLVQTASPPWDLWSFDDSQWAYARTPFHRAEPHKNKEI